MKKILYLLSIFTVIAGCQNVQQQTEREETTLDQAFLEPPDSARPWVAWTPINGNITREGITADLEAMKKVGISGFYSLEVGGLWWAPEGQVAPYSQQWHDLMQWTIQEAERLGLIFGTSLDFGYGSGGPHITPDISMQKLYWSQTVVQGGRTVNANLPKPELSDKNIKGAWLRPGKQLNERVMKDIQEIDSYRDIAVWAMPFIPEGSSYKIPQLDLRTGLSDKTHFINLDKLSPPQEAVASKESIIDLTSLMTPDGTLNWEAPPGKWQIIRFGHASNFRMTRPCPTAAVGLECNRLSPEGIETHFESFLKPILDKAGSRAGATLKYVFLDSWEAFGQNWTSKLPVEFYNRRGYDLYPWLPVLTGTVVAGAELTERFLWDFRLTISEVILANYHQRLKELLASYNVKFAVEPYGNLNVDNLQYAEVGDFIISEFWTLGEDHFPSLKPQEYYNSMKAVASVAHTTGRSWVGAEAFTSPRGWKDHPFTYKAAGDEAFCQGVNKFSLTLSAHQAYEDMVPGLTHQRWGGHFNRFNTWWKYSKPWLDYIARSQYLLQQGHFVADVCYFFGEGAPLHVMDMELALPQGYDYDVCSSNILQQMEVRDGKIVLPSGMAYRYLLLPNTDRLTLSSAKKIKELVESGAKVIARERVLGTPGLSGYPGENEKVKEIFSQLWEQMITESNWQKIFGEDNLAPDFEGPGLQYIHRRLDGTDIYFVANPEPKLFETVCSFRVSDKIPELWDPETGEIRELPEYDVSSGRVSVNLRFEPMQSWFIVFRSTRSGSSSGSKNFPEYQPIAEIKSPWQVSFDPRWGGPANPATFVSLADWSSHSDPGIRYYSGTAVYKTIFDLTASQLKASTPILIDLGQVEVIARVNVNGKECGIAWKPPYRVDISQAVHPGENVLEIEVVNTWVNRMIGDEQLPEDCDWIDWVRLKEWPEWFLQNDPRPSGRFTFTTTKHYTKDDPLLPSGLLGPVQIFKWK